MLLSETGFHETRPRFNRCSAIDVGVKARPTKAELAMLGEDFKREWPYFERAPDKSVMLNGMISGYTALRNIC